MPYSQTQSDNRDGQGNFCSKGKRRRIDQLASNRRKAQGVVTFDEAMALLDISDSDDEGTRHKPTHSNSVEQVRATDRPNLNEKEVNPDIMNTFAPENFIGDVSPSTSAVDPIATESDMSVPITPASGSRIVNLQCINDQLRIGCCISHEELNLCNIASEKRVGFASVFTVICRCCGGSTCVHSSKRHTP